MCIRKERKVLEVLKSAFFIPTLFMYIVLLIVGVSNNDSFPEILWHAAILLIFSIFAPVFLVLAVPKILFFYIFFIFSILAQKRIYDFKQYKNFFLSLNAVIWIIFGFFLITTIRA
ncbi:MAG: hypothetical protein KDF59_15530 [Nitrosomonas sp.]|nr:hypothetical protein [Nitrosomonas sp.]